MNGHGTQNGNRSNFHPAVSEGAVLPSLASKPFFQEAVSISQSSLQEISQRRNSKARLLRWIATVEMLRAEALSVIASVRRISALSAASGLPISTNLERENPALAQQQFGGVVKQVRSKNQLRTQELELSRGM